MSSAKSVGGADSYIISAISFLQCNFDLQNHAHFPFWSKTQA